MNLLRPIFCVLAATSELLHATVATTKRSQVFDYTISDNTYLFKRNALTQVVVANVCSLFGHIPDNGISVGVVLLRPSHLDETSTLGNGGAERGPDPLGPWRVQSVFCDKTQHFLNDINEVVLVPDHYDCESMITRATQETLSILHGLVSKKCDETSRHRQVNKRAENTLSEETFDWSSKEGVISRSVGKYLVGERERHVVKGCKLNSPREVSCDFFQPHAGYAEFVTQRDPTSPRLAVYLSCPVPGEENAPSWSSFEALREAYRIQRVATIFKLVAIPSRKIQRMLAKDDWGNLNDEQIFHRVKNLQVNIAQMCRASTSVVASAAILNDTREILEVLTEYGAILFTVNDGKYRFEALHCSGSVRRIFAIDALSPEDQQIVKMLENTRHILINSNNPVFPFVDGGICERTLARNPQ